MSAVARALATAACLVLVAVAAPAQISPGPLSRVHAALEGSRNCLRCHERGEGVSARACLACHTLLGRRIVDRAGLHARPDHQKCATCHIEHQGTEFALVDWGPRGERGFDHATTGYRLEGAHARVACRDCHRAAALAARRAELAGQASPERTYLGLATGCLSCHRDEHRGQFRPDSCTGCHGMDSWTAPLHFDHAATSFPLTGRHAQVACADCHPKRGDPTAAASLLTTVFRGVAHARCQDCHRDPHAARLGSTCESCHSTAGWRAVPERSFDHSRTRYPLLGKHRDVACAGCHGADGRAPRPAFARCADCHRDQHLGQLAGRGSACETCHDVAGFVPSSVTVERHREAFVLAGAHLAVPCNACHPRVAPRSLAGADARLVAASHGGLTTRLRIPGQGCVRCHADPHRGEIPDAATPGACERCHDEASWRVTRFDHARTRLPLAGRHAVIACAECHRRPAITGLAATAGPAGPAALRLRGLPLGCADCHADPHAGQFQAATPTGGVANACGRCHREDSWHALRFVHNRDARYALDGRHEAVPCASCHPVEDHDGHGVRRYRPLSFECAACHVP